MAFLGNRPIEIPVQNSVDFYPFFEQVECVWLDSAEFCRKLSGESYSVGKSDTALIVHQIIYCPASARVIFQQSPAEFQ